MAVLFSAVTVTANNEETEFLVRGIPREYDDLEGWSTFDDFMEDISEETEVLVHAEAYLYGDGETVNASDEEITYFTNRIEKDDRFSLTMRITSKRWTLPSNGHRKNYIEWRWNKMNEFERMQLMAEMHEKLYPSGTRIMLLSMGIDPCPVEDNTRGTVDIVDGIGTLHCTFDNGRKHGVIRGEDSFRLLTEEELAKEQNENIEESSDTGMTM